MRNALDQLRQATNLGGGDDPSVAATLLLPFEIECDEIDDVECEDRTALFGSKGELIWIRDPLIGPTGFVAAQGVKSRSCERLGEPRVDVLVGKEGKRQAGYAA